MNTGVPGLRPDTQGTELPPARRQVVTKVRDNPKIQDNSMTTSRVLFYKT
jgi:hypothetical protein